MIYSLLSRTLLFFVIVKFIIFVSLIFLKFIIFPVIVLNMIHDLIFKWPVFDRVFGDKCSVHLKSDFVIVIKRKVTKAKTEQGDYYRSDDTS